MGVAILKTSIVRAKNMLYYCGTSSDGFITVCKAEMARGRKAVKKKGGK
jgi:hypothetical protein